MSKVDSEAPSPRELASQLDTVDSQGHLLKIGQEVQQAMREAADKPNGVANLSAEISHNDDRKSGSNELNSKSANTLYFSNPFDNTTVMKVEANSVSLVPLDQELHNIKPIWGGEFPSTPARPNHSPGWGGYDQHAPTNPASENKPGDNRVW
jgi:hypothetical protein